MSVLGELDVASVFWISLVLAIIFKTIIPKKNGRFKTGYVDNKSPIFGTVTLWWLSSAVFWCSGFLLLISD